jgi:hypothetical protein
VLLAPELTETPSRTQQFVDPAVLDHAAVFEEQHPVGMTNAGQPVGHDHPGVRMRVGGQRLDDCDLVLVLQGTGCLVDQQCRAPFNRARAMLTRWRSPPDSAEPASPTTDSTPSGSLPVSSSTRANRTARANRSSSAPGSPANTFPRIVPWKRYGC